MTCALCAGVLCVLSDALLREASRFGNRYREKRPNAKASRKLDSGLMRLSSRRFERPKNQSDKDAQQSFQVLASSERELVFQIRLWETKAPQFQDRESSLLPFSALLSLCRRNPNRHQD